MSMLHRRSLLPIALVALVEAKGHRFALAEVKSSRKRPVIARLSEGVTTPAGLVWFREAMNALGHSDFALEIRDAAGHPERLPQLAMELVHLRVDVIWTSGSYATEVAQRATRTIPIVMVSADAVAGGIVTRSSCPAPTISPSI